MPCMIHHHHQILPVPPSSLIFRKAIKKRSHRRPARLLILFRSDPSYPSVLRSFVLQRTEIGIHRRHQECIIIIITSRGRRKSTNYIVIAGTPPTGYKMGSTCVIIFPLRNIKKLSKCSKCASEGGQMISGSNPARSPRDNSERRRCDDLALWENLPISLSSSGPPSIALFFLVFVAAGNDGRSNTPA